MAWLKFSDGRIVNLDERSSPLVLGRHADCDLVIRYAENRHAQIERIDGDYYLSNLDGQNGTYIRGQKLDRPVQLRDQDRVGIAYEAITFSFEVTKPSLSRFDERETLDWPEDLKKHDDSTFDGAMLRLLSPLPYRDFRIVGETTSIGRCSANDIVIPSNSISGFHAEIRKLGKSFVLSGLGSKNGTFVNRQRIESNHKLTHGDEIGLGRFVLQFIDSTENDSCPTSPLYRFGGKSVSNSLHSDTIDKLRFSAFCEEEVEIGSSFLIDVYCYLPEQRESAFSMGMSRSSRIEAGSKGPVSVERNSTITCVLDMPGFATENTVETIDWSGQIANAQFIVNAPDVAKSTSHVGKVRIVANGVQVANVSFSVSVVSQKEFVRSHQVADAMPVRTAFASYASDDRLDVLHFQRAAATFGIDLFVDVIALRCGADWAKTIYSEIPKRDLFCLFWSKPASESDWVSKEWRAALKSKGCAFIQPIPLCDPRDVPPPAELADCAHFNDLNQIAIEYEQQWRDRQ